MYFAVVGATGLMMFMTYQRQRSKVNKLTASIPEQNTQQLRDMFCSRATKMRSCTTATRRQCLEESILPEKSG